MSKPGQATRALVETVDIYPTLADLCGLETPMDLSGMSLKPLLNDPTQQGKDGACSFFGHGPYFGRTLRTERYRIVEWINKKTGTCVQLELYDHQHDSTEAVNIADRPENRGLVTQLLAQMNSESRAMAERVP